MKLKEIKTFDLEKKTFQSLSITDFELKFKIIYTPFIRIDLNYILELIFSGNYM